MINGIDLRSQSLNCIHFFEEDEWVKIMEDFIAPGFVLFEGNLSKNISLDGLFGVLANCMNFPTGIRACRFEEN